MKTQQEAVAWVKKQVGKRLDWDGYYGSQCVDLIRYYCDYLDGQQPPWVASATHFWEVEWSNNYSKHKTPQTGDIVVWGNIAWGHGHVAIVTSTRKGGFTSVDQNWVNANLDWGSPATLVEHDMMNVRGFIRPKFKGEEMLYKYTQYKEDLKAIFGKLPSWTYANWKAKYQTWERAKFLKAVATTQAKHVKNYQKEVANLKKKVDELGKRPSKGEVDKLQKELDATIAKLNEYDTEDKITVTKDSLWTTFVNIFRSN